MEGGASHLYVVVLGMISDISYGNRDWTAYVLRLGSQAVVISD
jgi:hypothetical protein